MLAPWKVTHSAVLAVLAMLRAAPLSSRVPIHCAVRGGPARPRATDGGMPPAGAQSLGMPFRSTHNRFRSLTQAVLTHVFEGLQCVLLFTIALSIVSSFRMHAVNATFLLLPAFTSRS